MTTPTENPDQCIPRVILRDILRVIRIENPADVGRGATMLLLRFHRTSVTGGFDIFGADPQAAADRRGRAGILGLVVSINPD